MDVFRIFRSIHLLKIIFFIERQNTIFNENDMATILSSKSAIDAASKGRDRNRQLRSDREIVKEDVMREAVYEKFKQNAAIRTILLSTGSELIIEKTTTDFYWGCGSDGTGKNMLGLILMETREKLRSNE